MIMTKSFSVDTDDCNLPEAQVKVEAAMHSALSDIENLSGMTPAEVEIISVTIVPYSIPEGGGSYRDFHYTDRGYIGLILYRRK